MARASGRKRSAPAAKQTSSVAKRAGTLRNTRKLKLVLSSSSSGSSLDKAKAVEDDDDELILSGEGEPISEAEEELVLESSSPVKSDKLQLKLPKAALQASTSPSASASELEDDEDEVAESSAEEYEEENIDEEEEQSVDLSKMTSRQRARYEQQLREDAYSSASSLPAVNEPVKKQPRLSEEDILKRAEKTRRRQLQRDEKLEAHKQATIQRLLQKQGARSKKMRVEQEGGLAASTDSLQQQLASARVLDRGTRYLDGPDRTILIVADEQTYNDVFSFSAVPRQSVHREETCARTGCNEIKKYTHAQLGKPVCSLACYRALF